MIFKTFFWLSVWNCDNNVENDAWMSSEEYNVDFNKWNNAAGQTFVKFLMKVIHKQTLKDN